MRGRIRLTAVVASALVLLVGIVTLVGLIGSGGQLGLLSALVRGSLIELLTRIFLQVTVMTVALTLVLGVLNLLGVHVRRLRTRSAPYSLVLLVSFFGVVGLVLFERLNPPGGTPLSAILLETVQVSVESALAGLLVVALTYGAYRMLRRRVTVYGVLFIFALLMMLVGELVRRGALPLGLPTAWIDWFNSVPVAAGARGILIGVALATLVAGVRVLLGQDRSYRE